MPQQLTVGAVNKLWPTPVAVISLHSLTWFELMCETLQKDCRVHMSPRWKETTTPYSISCLNVQGDFEMESWRPKLVRKPLFVEVLWLFYFDIGVIN